MQLVLVLAFLLAAGDAAEVKVCFQSHRGGADEAPENTLPAFEHSWAIPGAVPEADLRTTQDGVIVCLHDDTPKRTTNAPAPWEDMALRDIPLAEVRKWDAGRRIARKQVSAKVPTLDELLALMAGHPERQLYLDLKDVDVAAVKAAIAARDLQRQIIFVHGSPATCLELSGLYEGARTMTWLSGSPEDIQSRYEALQEKGFAGISQLQFHLQPRKVRPVLEYQLDTAFLRRAVAETRAAGVDLQLRPFVVTPEALRQLIDLGVFWYVTDAPQSFHDCVKEALAESG